MTGDGRIFGSRFLTVEEIFYQDVGFELGALGG